MHKLFTLLFLIVWKFGFSQTLIEYPSPQSILVDSGLELNKTSIRGLSVVHDELVWFSGSKGVFGKSKNALQNTSFHQLEKYKKSDFRDIEAFSEKKAVMMSSGFPALILYTEDGGLSWKESFRSADSAVFLDGMDFWNARQGVVFGDPINGHFFIMTTNDGGKTWKEFDVSSMPLTKEGEAAFAASGTSIRCLKNGDFAFVSGGAVSRFYYYHKQNKKWDITDIPIVQGKNSQGAFSFAALEKDEYNEGLFCFVGGDYLQDSLEEDLSNSAWFRSNPPLWFRKKYVQNTHGYRSCVESINSYYLICCGTSGVDISASTGVEKYWKNLSQDSFHVVRKAKRGKLIVLAGANGRIAKIRFK
ncbi:MAG: WD40/YVTN/BNR-like repeat-containing protein [Bacteroidia bacterium]